MLNKAIFSFSGEHKATISKRKALERSLEQVCCKVSGQGCNRQRSSASSKVTFTIGHLRLSLEVADLTLTLAECKAKLIICLTIIMLITTLFYLLRRGSCGGPLWALGPPAVAGFRGSSATPLNENEEKCHSVLHR